MKNLNQKILSSFENDIGNLKQQQKNDHYLYQNQDKHHSLQETHSFKPPKKYQDPYCHPSDLNNDVNKPGAQRSKSPVPQFDPYQPSKIISDIFLKKNEFNDLLQNQWLLNAQKNFSHLDEPKPNYMEHSLNKSLTNSFEFSETSPLTEPFSSSINHNDFSSSLKFSQSNEMKQRNSLEMKSNEKNSNLRQKFKPEPLIIPPTINSFQNFNFNPLLMHSQSMINPELYHSQRLLSNLMTNIYPNATFLKSPRLFNYDVKKQYTPPPMLSPFRRGKLT